jgi:hypothetical protein
MTIELLCHDTLYFADPTNFNDPFDCNPTVTPDSGADALRAILAELIKRRIAAETLAALSDARIQGKKAEAHADLSGKQDAQRKLENISYHATDPFYECSEEDAEHSLLVSAIDGKFLSDIAVESVVFPRSWTTLSFGVITPTSIKAFASAMVSPESRSRNSTRLSTGVADA